MPKDNFSSNEKKNQPFIRETMVENQDPQKDWRRKLLMAAGCGVVFGAAFLLTVRLGGGIFSDSGRKPEESIVIPGDETDAAGDETTKASEAERNETLSETSLEAAMQTMLESRVWTAQDLEKMYQALGSITDSIGRSMAVVTVTSSDTDWFQKEYQRDSRTFGVVIAVTNQEVLILTPYRLMEQADKKYLQASFGAYEPVDAYIKAVDAYSNLAVAAVDVEGLSDACRNYIQPVQLGSSYGISKGQPVIALGEPMGYTGSVGYGIITYLETDIQGVDCNYRLLHTDIHGYEKADGFLINLKGEIVGWLDSSFSEDSLLTAVGISELKSSIENLSNGKTSACLGITGLTITKDIMEKQQFPCQGVYITECLDRGPAFAAGLQNGDIITGISGKTVADMLDLKNSLKAITSNQNVRIQVQRKSGSEYKQLTFEVHLERR